MTRGTRGIGPPGVRIDHLGHVTPFGNLERIVETARTVIDAVDGS